MVSRIEQRKRNPTGWARSPTAEPGHLQPGGL